MTREITIEPVLNGYVCRVGCQRVVFDNLHLMLKEIGTYLEKPEETEVRYLNNALNKPHGPEPVRVENTMRQTDEPMGATRPR